MKASEKQAIIITYKDQFTYYLQSNGSDYEKLQLKGMKAMLKLFFSNKEITDIENSLRISSNYIKDFFESIESWLRQIEKEEGEKVISFEWTNKGLNQVNSHYDWLYSKEEYKGLKLAIDFAYKAINKEAA